VLAVPRQQVVDAVDGSDGDVKRIGRGLPWDRTAADQVFGDGDSFVAQRQDGDALDRRQAETRRVRVARFGLLFDKLGDDQLEAAGALVSTYTLCFMAIMIPEVDARPVAFSAEGVTRVLVFGSPPATTAPLPRLSIASAAFGM